MALRLHKKDLLYADEENRLNEQSSQTCTALEDSIA